MATSERVDLLNLIDAEARRYDPRIKNVMASFNTEYKRIIVATTDGLMVNDVQPLSRLNVTCIAEENGNRQMGTVWRRGPDRVFLLSGAGPLSAYAPEAARQAILT